MYNAPIQKKSFFYPIIPLENCLKIFKTKIKRPGLFLFSISEKTTESCENDNRPQKRGLLESKWKVVVKKNLK